MGGQPTTMAALAAQAVAGDDTAREALFTQVRLLAYRYCRARLGRMPGGDQTADDVGQEVCIAVLTALPRYRDEGRPFEAFVYGIAAHKVADAQRAAIRAPIPTEAMPEDEVTAAGPEDNAVARSEAATVRELLDQMPPHQREILVLRVVVGLSAEETGRAMSMTAGAVRVAQHRALARLRSMVASADAAALAGEVAS